MHEAQLHEQNAFLTLTYSDEHVPPDGGLRPEDFQKFMKRYRERVGVPLRYYQAGEYGEQLGRPHHHVCVFGHEFGDLELFGEREGIRIYTSELLDELWGHGFCTSGELTMESAAYVARYCVKKITVSEKSPDEYRDHYSKVDEYGEVHQVKPEYSTMSRRPGIAADWWKKYSGDVLALDQVVHQARRVKVPRYYDEALRAMDERRFEAVKEKRKKKAIEQDLKLHQPRLADREKVKRAAIQNIRRILR